MLAGIDIEVLYNHAYIEFSKVPVNLPGFTGRQGNACCNGQNCPGKKGDEVTQDVLLRTFFNEHPGVSNIIILYLQGVSLLRSLTNPI